jgi:hypothetical protein
MISDDKDVEHRDEDDDRQHHEHRHPLDLERLEQAEFIDRQSATTALPGHLFLKRAPGSRRPCRHRPSGPRPSRPRRRASAGLRVLIGMITNALS